MLNYLPLPLFCKPTWLSVVVAQMNKRKSMMKVMKVALSWMELIIHGLNKDDNNRRAIVDTGKLTRSQP